MTVAIASPDGTGVFVSPGAEAPDYSPLLRSPGGGIFHDPRWGRIMWSAYGNPCFCITHHRQGRVIGALQLVLQKSLLFGTRLCSIPYMDAAGVLAEDGASTAMMLEQAQRLREQTGARWVELRLSQPLPGLPTRTDKVTMHLPLPADPQTLWDQLKAKVRNQVRKAQKADLQAVSGGAELLGSFFAVYVRTMRDLGSPPHSRKFFELILRLFKAEVRIFVVYQARRPLAASLTLADHQALHVPWAGSDWRCSALCANMLLYWAMLEHGCLQGLPRFDFGRCSRDGGTHQFKKQWGSLEVPLYWQYLLPPGEPLPELRPDSPRYQRMVACWKRLPLRVVRHLGPLIMRKLS